jgi:Tfp pilus assembly protein PilV
MIRLSVKLRPPVGQGLLEATIAIGVVLVGLIGTVTLTTSSIISSGESENRIVAANLAREGIEAVRVIRDSNWLVGPSLAWDTGLNHVSYPGAITKLDPTTLRWSLYFISSTDFSNAFTKLYRDTDTGLYLQSEGALPATASQTSYARQLKIYAVCRQGSTETATAAVCTAGTKVGLKVVSTVQWSQGGQTHKLSLEDWLYNWRFAPPTYVP